MKRQRNYDSFQFLILAWSLLSNLNNYPLGKDVYDCIRRARTKPFDLNFDVQVGTTEELYRAQPKFAFARSDVSKITDSVRALYSGAVIPRVEQTIYEQMKKISILLLDIQQSKPLPGKA